MTSARVAIVVAVTGLMWVAISSPALAQTPAPTPAPSQASTSQDADLGDIELTSDCFPTPSMYLPLGEYPESDLEAIVGKVTARLPNLSPAELLRSMGEGVPAALQQVAPNLVPRARTCHCGPCGPG